MAVDDPEGLLRKLADANRAEATDSALGNAVLLEGCGIPAPILPNEESRLHLTMDGEKVIISEQGDVLARGDFYTPHRPWSGELLSNGMAVESVLPVTLTFIPTPGSAMEDSQTPSAQWQVVAAEKMAGCYLRHGTKFIKTVANELFADVYHRHAPGFIKALGLYNSECGPSMLGDSIQTTYLTVVFDELLRRAQKIPGVTSRLKIEVA